MSCCQMVVSGALLIALIALTPTNELVAQRLSPAEGPWSGQAQCVVVGKWTDYHDEQTHTWRLTGEAPTPAARGSAQVYFTWPATWTVQVSGRKTWPSREPGGREQTERWTAAHEMKMSLRITEVGAGTGRLRIGTEGQRGAPLGALRVTEVSGRTRDQSVQQWAFPAIEDSASNTTISGTSTRTYPEGFGVGPGQPPKAITTATCTWSFTRGSSGQISRNSPGDIAPMAGGRGIGSSQTLVPPGGAGGNAAAGAASASGAAGSGAGVMSNVAANSPAGSGSSPAGAGAAAGGSAGAAAQSGNGVSGGGAPAGATVSGNTATSSVGARVSTRARADDGGAGASQAEAGATAPPSLDGLSKVATLGAPPGNVIIGTAKPCATPGPAVEPTVRPTSVTFAWRPVAGATGYLVSDKNGNLITASPIAELTYTHQAAHHHIYSYSYNVMALFADDGCSITNLTFTPPRPLTPQVTAQVVTSAQPGRVTLMWGDQSDLPDYYLVLGPGISPNGAEVTASRSGQSYDITQLSAGAHSWFVTPYWRAPDQLVGDADLGARVSATIFTLGPRTIGLTGFTAMGTAVVVPPRTIQLTGFTATGTAVVIPPRTITLSGWTSTGSAVQGVVP